jgi:molybdopterin converting factor subunit 1
MTVTVYLFGHFRDVHPDGLTIEIPLGTTAAALADMISKEDSRLDGVRRICRAAVNEEYVPAETVLKDGDVVAFIPPMSGGIPEAEGIRIWNERE